MTDLPNVAPIPAPDPRPVYPTEAELVEVLTGLAPGWYLARDLLPRYNAWAKSKGKPDITSKTLGECLQRVVQLPRRKTHGHASAYEVTPASLTHRDWFKS